jgi:plasmid stability protein
MAVDMHIRDLDEATHRELVRRAEAAGVSLSTYVIDVLREHTALPSVDQWLDEMRAAPPLPAEGPDSVTLVHDGRAASEA